MTLGAPYGLRTVRLFHVNFSVNASTFSVSSFMMMVMVMMMMMMVMMKMKGCDEGPRNVLRER
jgi:hypothetical protein